MVSVLTRTSRVVFAILMAVSAIATQTVAASAQGRVSVVRDAEIETLLKQYALPIFKAAGLSRRGIQIVIVNNKSFNAFVDGRRIFVNTGALLEADTPNEIIGVIAHETGHLAGGHQQRLREQIARAATIAVVGGLVGAGAAVSGGRNTAGIGAGVAASSGSIANRFLLSYRRSEEMNADQAAVRYLNATGQSAAGMLATFERFSQNMALAGVQVNPYELSHPLPRERIALMEELARKSPYYGKKDSAALQLRHDMARAKIAAYTGGAAQVARTFRDNPRSLPARYGDAIATHLAGATRSALSKLDAVLKEQPKNAYLHEMKAEMLLTARQAREAVAEFKKAVALNGNKSGLIKARLGFAMVATGDRNMAKAAIEQLRAGLSDEPDNFEAYRQLSQAYGVAGDIANAELVMAEGYFRVGNRTQALSFAARAQQKFPKGTPGWRRANDILTVGR